jgi:pSer/pThr/pTyr-binding forkhead associated (FHA) protein
MAKLFLKFEQAVLKEVPLHHGLFTIGRLPDNAIQVDNLAVSGHHAKIYWEDGHYVIEDNNSLNGTFLNNRRVTKSPLKNNDVILIGKHTLAFQAGANDAEDTAPAPAAAPHVPEMEATMVLDTKKAREMIAAAGGTAVPSSEVAGHAPAAAPAAPARETVGRLEVLDGKTDTREYLLASKMCVIGKSDMASIKLKGFFAPNMAALINKRDNRYFIAASEAKIKVKINGGEIAGQKELSDGDIIEVAGIKMSFSLQE